MMILACDPGTDTSALVGYHPDNGIWLKEHISNHDVLYKLSRWRHVSSNGEPYHLVIEKVECYGMSVGADVFETVFWSGRFAQAWVTSSSVFSPSVDRIGRRQIKLHLCGDARAKDANIRQALIDKLGPQGTKNNPGPTYGISKHLWSALAIAVTYAETKI